MFEVVLCRKKRVNTKVDRTKTTVLVLSRALGVLAMGLMVACASPPAVPPATSPATSPGASDDAAEAVEAPPQVDLAWQPVWQGSGDTWHSRTFPGKKTTRYSAVRVDGRQAVFGDSHGSASMMRQTVRIEPAQLGQIGFAWKVPHLIPGANMGLRDHDDSPVRVMLAFEGDRSRLSARDGMLSELARALTGEEMPYATLMYVWCNSRPPGSVIASPRTDRIRSIVMESGPARLNQWIDYERDIRADFETAFGEAPGALIGVAIMSDSDNTESTSSAWYGAVRISPAVIEAVTKR
ncbi:MAG: hypothetical protein JWQ88_1546 [Rhodoferax sp.]|nr:hypothetical protein [Rhodoferax sp.]